MWPAKVSPEVVRGCGWLVAAGIVIALLAAAVVGLRP